MSEKLYPPIHPGEILLEEFIKGFELSQHEVSVAVRVPARKVSEIVQGNRDISAEMAIRLARYFGTSDKFWMNLQAHYDLEIARVAIGDQLNEITPRQVS